MRTAKSSPDPESWPKPENWSGGYLDLWYSIFGEYSLGRHYTAATKTGNHISVARMEKFADAVAMARLKGEL